MTEKIYKLQRPEWSSAEEFILAYPQDDPADMLMLPMIHRYLQWFDKENKIAFVYAEDKNNSLKVHKKAPWQDW